MPVCPGCSRRVSYEQLPVHRRCCDALRGSDEHGTPAPNPVEQYISELDKRLEEDLRIHEEKIDQRLHQLENKLRAK